MANVSLDQASTIVDAALAKGRETECGPLTVVVLDAGGHMVAVKREDGSGILRVEVAQGKAYGALGLGISSRAIGARNVDRAPFLAALGAAAGGRMVPVAGGVLLRDASGAVVGAVGVSGDASDKDEVAAIAGVEAAGLVADANP